MRESVQRQRGLWRFGKRCEQRNTTASGVDHAARAIDITAVQLIRILCLLLLCVLVVPSRADAQSPWERAASNLEQTFTGPLARSLALVSIVIGGLLFMFGEAGAKRQISGIVFGGGLALFATQFLAWLF